MALTKFLELIHRKIGSQKQLSDICHNNKRTMLVPFDTISDSSRIWIYQGDRAFSSEEKELILSSTLAFMEKWAAHGQDLKASVTIKYNQFLIIAADESFNVASGCSIDSSVHFVQELGSKFKIDFFDRMKLAFFIDKNVSIVPLNQLKNSIKEGLITFDSTFFHNTILTKGDLYGKWMIKTGESWLKRYFNVHESV